MNQLLTIKQAEKLFQFLEEKVDNFNADINEIKKFKSIYQGGSYNKLNDLYPGRLGQYEINHSPPIYVYDGTIYKNISEGNMPSICMKKEHHRFKSPTTGHGKLDNGYFLNKSEFRTYMKDELEQLDFFSALKADINLHLFNKEMVEMYVEAYRQLIKYCLEPIKGAPYPSD